MELKHVKLFEQFNEAQASEEFKAITHDWNMYLVPAASLETRPKSEDFFGRYDRTEDFAKAMSDADKRWIKGVEHYYVMPELQAEWECKLGWGCKKKPERIIKDVNFKVITTNTVQHVKIAHGAPTKELKNAKVAVPISFDEVAKQNEGYTIEELKKLFKPISDDPKMLTRVQGVKLVIVNDKGDRMVIGTDGTVGDTIFGSATDIVNKNKFKITK